MRGGLAAHKLIDAVEAAIELPFARGLAREFRLFDELVRSAQSAALRHVFFAERELGKIPGMAPAAPAAIASAGVVGAGTMGTGIAIDVCRGRHSGRRDRTERRTNRAREADRRRNVRAPRQARPFDAGRGVAARVSRYASNAISPNSRTPTSLIEAVFENMDVKKAVFAQLDAVCKPAAILASNTSTLDIDALAAVTKRAATGSSGCTSSCRRTS